LEYAISHIPKAKQMINAIKKLKKNMKFLIV